MKAPKVTLQNKTYKFKKEFEFSFNVEDIPERAWDDITALAFQNMMCLLHRDGTFHVWGVNSDEYVEFSLEEMVKEFLHDRDAGHAAVLLPHFEKAAKLLRDAVAEDEKK